MFGELTKPLTFDFQSYINELQANPWQYFTLALDIVIVCFLLYEFVKFTKKSRVWQLLKGIAWLIVITILSNVLRLRILNFILTSFMTYGVIALLVIFQPELRRALEQLGSSTFTKMFGMDKSLRDKTKEDIYKVAIATQELGQKLRQELL